MGAVEGLKVGWSAAGHLKIRNASTWHIDRFNTLPARCEIVWPAVGDFSASSPPWLDLKTILFEARNNNDTSIAKPRSAQLLIEGTPKVAISLWDTCRGSLVPPTYICTYTAVWSRWLKNGASQEVIQLPSSTYAIIYPITALRYSDVPYIGLP